MKQPALLLLSLASLSSVFGCAEEKMEPARVQYYLKSYGRIQRLQRVVLIELDEEIQYPGLARNMTRELMRSLQDKGLFHVQVRSRHEPICRDLGLEKPGSFSLDDMATIRKQLNCDGILFGRIVGMDFYPHTRVSLFLALLDLRRGEVAWCVDNTWDAADASVQQRIRQFVCGQRGQDLAPNPAEVVPMSPRNFQRFVAYEAAKTLSPRGSEFGQLVKYKQRLELYDFLEENW